MDAKVGDRISLDAKKVGQARRTGAVRALVQGLSGVRYEVAWDDGSVSVISPGAGVLLVEGGSARKASNRAASKPAKTPKKAAAKPKKAAAKAKPKKAAAKPKKAAAKAKPKAKKTRPRAKAKKSAASKRTKSR